MQGNAEKRAAPARRADQASTAKWATAFVALGVLLAVAPAVFPSALSVIVVIASLALTAGLIWLVIMCIRLPFNVQRMRRIAEQQAKAD